MGITKVESYNEQTLTLASIFKALGHPARIAILEYLAKEKKCICGDIKWSVCGDIKSLCRHKHFYVATKAPPPPQGAFVAT